MKPNNLILEGLCGSKAYGLDTETSDEDWKGIFVAPTDNILGLKRYRGRQVYDHTDPDWCYYEVEKFIKHAIGCNPTLIEMLWLDEYRILTEFGQLLIDGRNHFLSTGYVKNAYTGYVFSQAKKLNARGGT